MNPFEAVAEQQMAAPVKAKQRRLEKLVVKSEADAPMVASPLEKAAFERQQLLKLFNRHMAERRHNLLNGEYGTEIKALLQLLDSLTPSSPPALMSFMAKCGWFQQCDYGTRHDILSLINMGIARFRVRQGLPPFDDGLPGEAPTVFCIARHELTGAPI